MAFGYYKPIVIDHTKVSGTGDLSNFPVLINKTDALLKTTANSGHVTSNSGYDIYFYSDSALTTKLDHELIFYAPTTGQIIAWVRIPTLDGDANTTIYMAYGDSGITTNPSATGTWNTNYKAVYHFEANGNDSTANAYNATINGAAVEAAKVGKGLHFDGTDDYVDMSSTGLDDTSWLANGQACTVECWLRLDTLTPSSANTVFWEQNNGSGGNRFLTWFWEDSSHNDINFYPNSLNHNTDVISIDTWYHVVVTLTGTATSGSRMWVNGTEIGTAMDYTPAASKGIFNIGRMPSGNSQYHDGFIDEWRLLSDDMTADWIITSYNTQNDPASFLSLGTEVEVGGGEPPATAIKDLIGGFIPYPR